MLYFAEILCTEKKIAKNVSVAEHAVFIAMKSEFFSLHSNSTLSNGNKNQCPAVTGKHRQEMEKMVLVLMVCTLYPTFALK